ncbi:hypothetical protein [Aliiglaciecola sp. M165]|uniref:hypothetical protein n=1 Tax=Aliiglaciecola sp. M165 TaxID=2593649 RepID=UPI00117F287D|nr:hypothetical protein [Aliiglaciecola sp. M165]TRY34047.1 hypothetical protein FM019_01960 [Aliiglaciecola sp. M165]
MKDNTIIRILKVTMTIGICLILLGVYFHLFNSHIEEMGIKGIIISAACVAIGMILSLPTKMFLTFILVNREAEQNKHSNKS